MLHRGGHAYKRGTPFFFFKNISKTVKEIEKKYELKNSANEILHEGGSFPFFLFSFFLFDQRLEASPVGVFEI